jgi:hypothetical protein
MHNLNSYYAFGHQINTNIDFEGSLPKPISEFETLSIGSKIIEPEIKQPTRIYRKGQRANFKEIPEQIFMSWPNIAKFEINNHSLNYEFLGKEIGDLKLFLLSEPIGCFLFKKGYFLLHGSSIYKNCIAHIFTGEPGAGKSTTAAAFYKNSDIILSDDLVVIKIIDNKPYVIPSLPHIKIWKNTALGLEIDMNELKPSFEGIEKYLLIQDIEKFPQTPIPLGSITHLVAPKSRKSNREFGVLDAPIELIKHFPLPIQLLKKERLALHFKDSIAIGQSVKLSQLKRPLNFELLMEFVENFN